MTAIEEWALSTHLLSTGKTRAQVHDHIITMRRLLALFKHRSGVQVATADGMAMVIGMPTFDPNR